MILIINPPSPDGTVSNKDMMGGLGQLYPAGQENSLVPPLDMFYCAAALDKAGADFKVMDSLVYGGSGSEFLAEASGLHPEHVLLRTSLPTLANDADFAAALKRAAGAKIWFFGPAAELFAQELLAGGGDFVICGEAETVVANLAASRFAPAGITGLAYLKEGRLTRTGAAGGADLDSLAYPLWPKESAYRLPSFFGGEAYLPLLTSRGCPFGCSYCPYTRIQGRTWRARGVDSVLAEIRRDYTEYGVSNFLFRDPEFTMNEERTLRLCGGIINLGFKISWVCETRPDTLNDSIIERMAGAGCKQINFGVESISASALACAGRKYVPPGKIMAAASAAERNGISLFCFFIMGLPGQTKIDILNDIDFAARNLPGRVQFTCATPYPTTDMYAWADARGFIEVRDYSRYTGYFPVMRNEHLSTAQLGTLLSYAYSRLRSRGGSDAASYLRESVLRLKGLYLKYFL